jgi:hypothetical protein
MVVIYSHFFRIRCEWNTPSLLWGFIGIIELLKEYLLIIESEIASPTQTRQPSSHNICQFRLINKLTALFHLSITK